MPSRPKMQSTWILQPSFSLLCNISVSRHKAISGPGMICNRGRRLTASPLPVGWATFPTWPDRGVPLSRLFFGWPPDDVPKLVLSARLRRVGRLHSIQRPQRSRFNFPLRPAWSTGLSSRGGTQGRTGCSVPGSWIVMVRPSIGGFSGRGL